MSHISTQKVKIKNANPQMLERAINLMLANIKDLKRVNHIIDWNGRRIEVKNGIGLKLKNSHYGQIVSIKNGQISFTGEDMDNTRSYMENQLVQFYNAGTTLAFMENQGYQYNMAYNNGKVLIHGTGR